ncbi:MAG TPA: histidine phosphatase family protein [Dietzia sp.]|nr:histidine phosphatase family protein [uncultured Dietzia sp.]HMT50675.1 histidine phosphatase family protein [Dietzia sp.]
MSGGPGWTGATGRPTRIVLARHGQTPLSVDRRYSGQGDPELTDLGVFQAERTAGRLASIPHLAAVVSSPLGRCLGTAERAAEAAGVPLVVEDDLIETDFGRWEGLTFREAAEQDPELHARWLGDVSVPPPGGESFAAVRARVERGLRRIVEDRPGGVVAVVSHVTPIKLVIQAGLGVGDELLFRLHLDLASVSDVRFYPDGPTSVHLVNDTSHLD